MKVVLEAQIIFEIKAQADSKVQHTRQYVTILNRLATQISGMRWGYKNTSRRLLSSGAYTIDHKARRAPATHRVCRFQRCGLGRGQ